MKRNRPLRPSERYFRYSDNTINVAANPGSEFLLKPIEDTTYHVSGLQLVLVGEDLLKNHHQLGRSPGTINFSQLVKDNLGILWDRFNMYRTLLNSSRDWRIIEKQAGVTVLETAAVAGKKPVPAALVPNIRPEPFRGAPMKRGGRFLEWEIPGPHWHSSEMDESGDELFKVAWKLAAPWQDADLGWDEFGNNYRIDLKITYMDGSSEKEEIVTLTHWKDNSHSSTPVDALPAPASVPLPRPGLGHPIPSVLKEKYRLVNLGKPIGYPISVQAIVYFDVRDLKLPARVNHEDFLKHPPGLESLAFYYKYKDRDPANDKGKRSHGEFISLAELIDLSGDITRASGPASYEIGGVAYDVAYLDLPFSGRITGKWGEEMSVSYQGTGLEFFEVTAPDAAATFDDKSGEE